MIARTVFAALTRRSVYEIAINAFRGITVQISNESFMTGTNVGARRLVLGVSRRRRPSDRSLPAPNHQRELQQRLLAPNLDRGIGSSRGSYTSIRRHAPVSGRRPLIGCYVCPRNIERLARNTMLLIIVAKKPGIGARRHGGARRLRKHGGQWTENARTSDWW